MSLIKVCNVKSDFSARPQGGGAAVSSCAETRSIRFIGEQAERRNGEHAKFFRRLLHRTFIIECIRHSVMISGRERG
jgi:hypothetical protein